MLSPLDFAIVDEVDSILIDESRNPMLISRQTDVISNKIKICAEVVDFNSTGGGFWCFRWFMK